MKNKAIFLLVSLCIGFVAKTPPLTGEETRPLAPYLGHLGPQLRINNRPLAKINDKVISLLDVVKKMDLFLYDQHPSHTFSTQEKAYFYLNHWQEALEEMICNKLVLLDAKQKGIQITEGQIHQELEDRFGPSTIFNLDQIGLDFREAYEAIRDENLIRQMMWYKVHSKASQGITPQIIKESYQTHLENNPPVQSWTYSVLSIRDADKSLCQEIAEKAYQLLSKGEKKLEQVADDLREQYQSLSIVLTEKCAIDTPNLSKQHHEALKALSPQTFSVPISQVSRFDKGSVSRIFYLDACEEKGAATFDAMHDLLKSRLLNASAEKERKSYFNFLKKRYGFDKVSPRIPLSEDYEPFTFY